MDALFSLGLYLCLYAVVCWLSYAICRWLEGELFYMWGRAAMIIWAIGVVYVTYIATANISPQANLNPLAVPGWLMVTLIVMLFPFGIGSWLHRRFSESLVNWGEGICFYAVYLLLVWSFNALLLVGISAFRIPIPVSISALMPPGIVGNIIFSLFWLFPLGAPVIWQLLLRIRRGLDFSQR